MRTGVYRLRESWRGLLEEWDPLLDKRRRVDGTEQPLTVQKRSELIENGPR